MCRVLGVSPSGYYAWRGRGPSRRARRDEESRGTYGMPRVHAELVAGGCRVGRNRVARLMRESGLAGVSGRRGTRTTRVDRGHLAALDRVERPFRADAPNRIWVADTSYVPTWTGFVYLVIVLDVFSRKVVGRWMANHLRTVLVLGALNMAICKSLDLIRQWSCFGPGGRRGLKCPMLTTRRFVSPVPGRCYQRRSASGSCRRLLEQGPD